MKIGICEDDGRTRQETIALVKEVSRREDVAIEIFAYENSEALLFALPDLPLLDLLILDIQMGALDGMSLAKKIRQSNQSVALLFVSNYDDYVFDGYDVNAIGYVMKPLTAEKLVTVLRKVQQMQQQESQALVLEGVGQQERVYLYDILYVESEGHYLKIVTQEKDYRQKGTLTQLLTELDENFIQVHRSYLVNLNFITTLQASEILLANEAIIPLARSQKKQVQGRFLAHYRGLAHD